MLREEPIPLILFFFFFEKSIFSDFIGTFLQNGIVIFEIFRTKNKYWGLRVIILKETLETINPLETPILCFRKKLLYFAYEQFLIAGTFLCAIYTPGLARKNFFAFSSKKIIAKETLLERDLNEI